jgi:hypothetical protein
MSIYKKLFKITSTMDKMKKDSTNPFFNSKYFDVNQLIEAVRPALIAEDLLLLQPIENGAVGTRIVDVDSGDSVEAFIPLPDLSDPQKIGSAVTYYRRYTLQSLMGVEAMDDDANYASHGSKKPQAKNTKSNDDKLNDDNKVWLNEGMPEWDKMEEWVRDGGNPNKLRDKYKVNKQNFDYFLSIAK